MRQELKAKAKIDRENFDKRIIEQARREMEQEQEQKRVLHSKVLQQKELREKMINEAKMKRDEDSNKVKNDERVQVQNLQAEIEKEKTSRI